MTAWLSERGANQQAFFVNYGQDNFDREFACARVNTQQWGVPLEVVDIHSLRNSFVGRFPFPINLYDCDVKNPLGQITTLAMSVLVAGVGVLAERFVLAMGIHHTDMDKRPVLQNNVKTLEEGVRFIVQAHTDYAFRLLLPFMDEKRSNVIATGIQLGVELQNTWSCHENTGTPCQECEGCAERAEAFDLAGEEDPLLTHGFSIPVRATQQPRIPLNLE